MAANFVFLCLALLTCVFAGNIPDYIHVCHRNDPEVAKCIIQSVELLRPKLRVGIPELDIPAIEPLHLPEIVIARGSEKTYRAVGNNVKVMGLSDFVVTKLKLDVLNNIFYIGAKFNSLRFLADIDVNLRFLVVPVQGQGNLEANATNVIGNVILKADVKNENGVDKMHFKSVELDLDVDNIDVRIKNLFRTDDELGEGINRALSENSGHLFEVIKPIAEKKVSDILYDLINKVVKNFAYDEVFPA